MKGTTLAINLASAEDVNCAWGGYSGYVADREGNRWELAWALGLDGAARDARLRPTAVASLAGRRPRPRPARPRSPPATAFAGRIHR